MAKPKVKTREYWRKKCVTLAKKIVRTEADFTCAFCGSREPNIQTHGSHIYAEGVYKNMSADIDNILCLCFTHHTGGWNAKQPSWHKDPVTMVNWFNEKYPDRAADLKKRTQNIYQVNFEESYKRLQHILKVLEAKKTKGELK